MRKLALHAKVPDFERHRPGQCGLMCARFVLEAGNKNVPLASWTNRAIGTLPREMVKILAAGGQNAEIVRVPSEDRIAWLENRIGAGKMVLLIVWVKAFSVLLQPHWIAVCGMDEGRFLIYDDRVRGSSRSRRLPIGNRTLTCKRALKFWREVPLLRKTSIAVVTL